MSDNEFDINALNAKICVIIFLFAVPISILTDIYIFPDHARIIAFSMIMSSLAIYTANGIKRYTGAQIFLSIYVILHIVIIFLPFFRDSRYGGPILFPFAIGDYVVMIFGLQKFTRL